MVATALTAPLRNIELFQGLSAMQISEIARMADRVVFKPGQVIVRRDEPADSAFVIVAGEAMRVEGPAYRGDAAVVPAGSLVGEMAMLVETEHSATIVAATAVRALKINRERLLAQMSEDPTLADHFVEHITGRLQRVADEMRSAHSTLEGPLALPPPDRGPVDDSIGATRH